MLQIGETIVSFDLFEKKFVCNLSECKGICCVEGNAGAPLTADEVPLLEELLPHVWDDLSPRAQQVIRRQGVSYLDLDQEPVTSIVDGEDCVFTCYDEQGHCQCAIEKAYRAGKASFYKPISCHLYPLRLKQYDGFVAVNYHRWDVCTGACRLGEKLNVPLYRFLREPLVRRFGAEWYDQLEYAAQQLEENGGTLPTE